MTKLQIQDAKTQLLDSNEALFTAAGAEKRGLTDAEKQILAENIQKLEDLDLQERSLSFKENNGKMVFGKVEAKKPEHRFSLIKAINDHLEHRSFDDATRDFFTMGKHEFRKAGVSSTGDIVIPTEFRANILAGTPTAGQEIVAEEKKQILPPLTENLVFSKVGATFLSGLVGNVSIPAYAGTSVAWKTEVEAAADGGGAFSEVELSPKRITCYVDVSKLFLAQDSVGAEQLLLSNIANAVARKIESTVLGSEVGSSTQPYGMALSGATGVAAGVPTWNSVVGLEGTVDTANALDGNLAYITNAAGRTILKTIDKGTDTGEMLCENNMVNGYPLLVTNSACATAASGTTGNLLVFGNWADLVIGQWGGYDITIDPYSKAATNQVRIVVNAYVDVKGMRGHTGTGATQNDYAHSFAIAAITAS